MRPPESLRPQSRWLVRQLSTQTGMTEAEVERGILALIERGHLRLVPGAGPDGSDGFEPIIRDSSDG